MNNLIAAFQSLTSPCSDACTRRGQKSWWSSTVSWSSMGQVGGVTAEAESEAGMSGARKSRVTPQR